jgi:hypothetical protein
MNSPLVSVLRAVRANALEGESYIRTARRCLVYESLVESGGDGKRAAEILGISNRSFCYFRRKYGMGKGQGHELSPHTKDEVSTECSATAEKDDTDT